MAIVFVVPGLRDPRRRAGLVLGPTALFAVLVTSPPAGMEPAAWRTAGVGLLMAVWWITEAIPIPATSLLPLALLPLLGLGDIEAAATPYANPVIFLFMGGFMLAQAMQRWDLHRRIALALVGMVGTRPTRLVAGFMLATAFLSMWVSNTATAVMMLPIGLSVAGLVLERPGGPDPATSGPVELAAAGSGAPGLHPGSADANFGLSLMLGIAYAASIGGAATLIGTPPNALLAGFMAESHGVSIGFGQWMLVGVPLAVLMLPLTWLLLVRWIYPVRMEGEPAGAGVIREEIRKLGPPGRGEILVGIVFVATAAAWISRPLLEELVPGITDAGIAITAAVLLFLIPVDIRRGEFLLNWEWARRIPWDVLILFGGGLSLAGAIIRTGLADWIGSFLAGVGAWPVLAVMVVVAGTLIFLTELTSNTASAAAFLPVVAALAVGIGQDPLLLAVPAALAASCAFMLPVATPPNAIVYGSGHVTIPQMARAGLVLNLLFLAAIPLLCYGLLVWLSVL